MIKQAIKQKRITLRPYPVLIVKPLKVERDSEELVSLFIAKAFQRGIGEPLTIPSKLPELARNYAINEFLHNPIHSKKTHIFFIDADTLPDNDFAIEKLLGDNKDFVCGITPIVRVKDKTFDCMWSPVLKNEAGNMENIGIDEIPSTLFKAHRVGGTTQLINRRVFDKLKPPYQKTEFNDDWTNVQLSEDIYFSDTIREAGFDLWVDPSIVCHHYHKFDLLDIFELYNQMKSKIINFESEIKRLKIKTEGICYVR